MKERIGVVAIGRNEGECLKLCLTSVAGIAEAVVYVDSGSSDGSVTLARSMGVEVVELDLSTPFTAARARNAGAERLHEIAPDISLVQFVDGDCEIVPGWLDRAEAEFHARPGCAVVCGRNREQFPDRSIYNRLADIEWETPIGEGVACGGNAMIRADVFTEIGGFEPSLIAGEEPELCHRIQIAGWSIVRIDAEMTRHDLGITRFGDWWRRSIRGGYGSLDVTLRSGGGPFARQVFSTRLWTIGWASSCLISAWLAWASGSPIGVAGAGVIAMAPVVQMGRMAVKIRRRVDRTSTAIAYGAFTMTCKWGELIGQFRRLGQGRKADRKSPPASPLIDLIGAIRK
jgi:GT2 family glycosyltransferase